ncbi:MAG: divergent polysaccharide deacetylase family protein [Holosporaceae bacterium]|nr:divergent polysaccharide deacetylase family protein [Holosporaceae bacterium]
MKRNKKLFLAWAVFLVVAFLFVVLIEMYHYFNNERPSDYQCRILINKDSEIIESIEVFDLIQREKTNVDAKFYEKTKYGDLPKISSDGASVFDEYSSCLEISSKKELRIAVLVNDGSKVNAYLKLNNQRVTFILPHYLDKLKNVVEAIKKNGHEFFIQMPTQSSVLLVSADKNGAISPFLANANIEDTLDNLLHLLGSTKYALGIANVSPTLFTKSEKNMTVVAHELLKRGLAFLNFEKSDDLVRNIARKSGLIYINATTMFEANNFDASKLKNGDILIINLEQLDNFMKVLPSDWLLTPISASVRR